MKRYLFFLFLIFSSCKNNNYKEDENKNSQIEIPEFNSDRAWKYLNNQVDFGPRNPNSIGHDKTLQFLTSILDTLADKIYIQTFNQFGYNENLKLSNIFASFNPDLKNRIVLLAHWDTRPRSENDERNKSTPILGANDGASGVAILLEIANALKKQKLNYGVDILLTDGEDYGKQGDLEKYSIGAKYFVKNKPIDYNPKFGILLDMVGDKDLNIPIEINSKRFAPQIVNGIWESAQILNIIEFQNFDGNEIYDDHIPFNEAGIPTVDIIDFDYNFWHTTNDTPINCSKESLEKVGKVILHFLYNNNF